jgi:hypothetical protein
MSVGVQTNKGAIDASLTDLAVTLRNLAQKANNLMTPLQASGQPIATVLAELGYATDPNPANPGGVSDAAWAAQLIGYMSTMSGVYYGQIALVNADGTTAAINFNTLLSPTWGGQIG